MIAAAPLLVAILGMSRQNRPATRPNPSSRESLTLVGLGSWKSFNAGNDKAACDAITGVMRNFFQVDWQSVLQSAAAEKIDSSKLECSIYNQADTKDQRGLGYYFYSLSYSIKTSTLS